MVDSFLRVSSGKSSRRVLLAVVLGILAWAGCGPQPTPSDSLFGYLFPTSSSSGSNQGPGATPEPADSKWPETEQTPSPERAGGSDLEPIMLSWPEIEQTATPEPTVEPDAGPTPSPIPLWVRLQASADPNAPLSWQFQVDVSPPSAVRLWCVLTTEDPEEGETHLIEAPRSSAHVLALRGLMAASAYRCWAEAVSDEQVVLGRSEDVTIETEALQTDPHNR